jgi:hypothetical protein
MANFGRNDEQLDARETTMIAQLFEEQNDQVKACIRATVRDERDVSRIAHASWEELRLAVDAGKVNSPEHATVLLHQISRVLTTKHHRLDEPRTPADGMYDIGHEGDVLELLGVVRNMPDNIRLIFDGGSSGNPGRSCLRDGKVGIVADSSDLMVLGYSSPELRSVAKDGSYAFAFDGR